MTGAMAEIKYNERTFIFNIFNQIRREIFMKRRLTMILACLFLSIGMALAQSRLTGVVTSAEDGEPVVGASVKAVGLNAGAVTNVDGEFTINVPVGTELQVTYLGMVPKTVKAASNMRIVLEPENQMIDEVMVVAYGTAKKSAFTGSAAVLGSDQIKKTADSNPLQSLTGKVSGVQINASSGQPGNSNYQIRIRGIGSMSSNTGTQPLVILDGAPFPGDMNTLNPNDIASMTVLKDAASSALYGARGANGVIIITTKNGKEGTSGITVDAKWGSNSRAIPDYKSVTSPAKYYEMWYGALKNYASNRLGYNDAQAGLWANQNMIESTSYGLGYNIYNVPMGQFLIGSNGKLNPNATIGRLVVGADGVTQYLITPDDWADAAYGNGLRQEYSVTANGSNDKGSYYMSFNYLDNEGITIKSDYKRLSTRLKGDYNIRPWLKMSGNFDYAHYDSQYLSDESASSSGNLFNLRSLAPIYPLYIRDAQGRVMTNATTGDPEYDYGDGRINGLTRPMFGQSNPLNDIMLGTDKYEGNSFNATGSAEIRFLEDFMFTTRNTAMLNEQRQNNLGQNIFGQSANYGGSVSVGHTRTWAYNYQQLLNWHHQFGKHDAEVMIGHEYYRSRDYVLGGSKTNIFSLDNAELAGAVVNGEPYSYTTDYNTEGYFGRAQYNYDTRYFASLSFRRDASSRFHPDHRWGNFWSFGGAWILSKEKWFNVSWVDELKIKASYGEQGNDNIPDFLYTDRFSIANNDGEISLTPSGTKGNENITWEKNANFNAGVEFSLFKGRFMGSVEYFLRKTSDMLTLFSLPPSSGYTSTYSNTGNMSNNGVELELEGSVIRTKDFEWGLNLNFTAYKNEITKINAANKTETTTNGVKGYANGQYFYGEGESMYNWYMKKFAGVNPENGHALYYQVIDGELGTTEVASEATNFLCGSALPWSYGGFGTTFAYKGFDLSVDFTYQLGGKAYDSEYASQMAGTRGYAFHTDLLNAWTPQNPNTNVPIFEAQYQDMAQSSDRFLTSASYLCLQNVNLGYTLPAKIVTKAGLTNLRVYLSGSNLWLWSKRQGLDPRQSISGATSSSTYSPIRTISGGVTISF